MWVQKIEQIIQQQIIKGFMDQQISLDSDEISSNLESDPDSDSMVMMSKEEGERQEVASESVRSGKVVKKRKRRKRRRKSLKLKEKEEDVPKIHKNKSIFSKTFDLDAYQRQLDEKINNHLDSVSVSSEEDNPHEGLSRKVNEEDRLSDDADFERLSNDQEFDKLSNESKCPLEKDQSINKLQESLYGELLSEFDHSLAHSESRQVQLSERTGEPLLQNSYKKESLKATSTKKNEQTHSEFNSNSSMVSLWDKKERPENKKRYSRKTLQLISRRFSDYLSYCQGIDKTFGPISLDEIGKGFNLNHSTVHLLYAEWMADPCFYERLKRYDRYRKHQKNPEKKLTLLRMEHVKRLVKQNPFLTQYQLCVQLNRIEELKVSKGGEKQSMTRTVVGKLLRMCKYRKKRVKCIPKEKNTSKSLEKRYEYSAKYKEIIEKRGKVYFLDESGFNLYMTRDKAWSRPNEEVTVNCPISKGKRFSLIAIIGDDGLAHWRFIEGNYRKYEYLDFIRELFQKLNDNRDEEDKDREIWLVLDNCAIHDKEQTFNLAKDHNINILYLPSYSPQLNPIQNWFHQVKSKLKKTNYSGQNALASIMESILKQYQEHDFSAYFSASLRFVEKGISREKF